MQKLASITVGLAVNSSVLGFSGFGELVAVVIVVDAFVESISAMA